MNIAVLRERLETLDSLFSGKELSVRKPARALVLDLSDEGFYEWKIPDVFLRSYVSGPALGARIWAEFAGFDVDEPSSYESGNPIVITASSVSNSGMPGCESVSIAFRSPVTENLSFNVVSNTVGMRLRAIGYSALVITGRLRRPAVIDIRKSGVEYKISEVFIGYRVSQMEAFLGLGPMKTALSIGPAGEQKVPYASVVCEGVSTGRGGLGCVFGYKNIKALCITGFDTAYEAEGSEQEIKKTFDKLYQALDSSPYCKAMQRGGSSCLVKNASRFGWAPVSNFNRRTDPRLFHLSGDETSRRYGEEHGGCIGCPVLCRHRTEDGISIPGYESVLMLGSNIGCFDMNKIIERYAQCLDYGLDPVSAGNVMGWANEALPSGRLSLFEPDFSFNDNSRVLPLIEMIGRRIGPGEPLSYGTEALGRAFKDESFAYSIKRLECGPYDYRGAFAQSISDCMGFWFPNYFEIHSSLCRRDYADWAVLNERLVMGLESYGISPALIVPTIIDTRNHLEKYLESKYNIIPNTAISKLKPSLIAETISVLTNTSVQSKDIYELGDRCWRLIYEIDRVLGFNMLEDAYNLLPQHFCVDSDSNHKESSIVPFRRLIDRYCFLRKQTIAVQCSNFNNS